MKDNIKIFGDPLEENCENDSIPSVKHEPVFQNTHEVYWNRSNRGRWVGT